MLWLQLHSNRGTQEMASFISWGNQFYTIIRTQLIVKDLCTKEVVGHASSKRMTKELVIKALKMALERARPADGLIFHSDRGSQYCSKAFRSLLKRYNTRQSMSNKGNPYDNAPAENFFGCLKCECTGFYRFRTRSAAKQVIWEYIEIF